jgi:signal transduction histidine kinase
MQAETRVTDTERGRVEAVVKTLAGMKHRGGTVAEIAHDARNMVTALALYCDLLGEPGVLTDEYIHYANELRLVSATSRRLVEKLMLLDVSGAVANDSGMAAGRTGEMVPYQTGRQKAAREQIPREQMGRPLAGRARGPVNWLGEEPMGNLQKELLVNRNVLDTVAGPAIAVTVRAEGGAFPVGLSPVDLTRVLVNLVKNAAEAMGRAGSIQITLRAVPDSQGDVSKVRLAVQDSGHGIPDELLETIFEAGYTRDLQSTDHDLDGGWPSSHRGLGLSITRSIIEAAGGRIWASNRAGGGACFEIELPVEDR